MTTEDIPSGRLYWRCRRGTKELDRVLGAYLKDEYPLASTVLKNEFVNLLEQQDPDIYDWLMAATPAPDAFIAIVEQLQIRYIRSIN